MTLTQDLIDFLLLDTPIEKPRRDGFMDIVEVQYHENTISRIYTYFLDSQKNSIIASLFLNSLLQIVRKKTGKDLEFGDHFCQTERQTDRGNRIDILIKTGNEDFKKDDYALVIENKIFSDVRNDLLDYWNTVRIPDERKVGVLLTLKTSQIPVNVMDFFVNITHAEWMSEIRAMGLPYDLDVHLYVYLNDFIRNMENIVSSTSGLSEDARFYFQHAAKVQRAMKTHEAARFHVVNQLKIFAEKIGLELYGSSVGWRHAWDYKSHVYYVFGFEQTLREDPSILVILEVYKDGIARYEELRQRLREGGYYEGLSDDNKSNQSWAHLAYKEYKLSQFDLEHLGNVLYDKIKSDFAEAYQVVHRTLHG